MRKGPTTFLFALVTRNTSSLLSSPSIAIRYSSPHTAVGRNQSSRNSIDLLSIRSGSRLLKAYTKSEKPNTGLSIRTTMNNNEGDLFPYVYNGDRAVPSSELPSWMLSERARVLTANGNTFQNTKHDCVVYWMQRDMRTVDNWALLLAQHLAHLKDLPLHVVHVLSSSLSSSSHNNSNETNGDDEDDVPPPLDQLRLTQRHGRFLLGGLKCVHEELTTKNVPFHVIQSSYEALHQQETHPNVLQTFLSEYNPAVVVCDTNVLRHTRRWNESPTLISALDAIKVPLYQVDAHNVVPVWLASPKREVGARTLRSKLHKLVDKCLQNRDYKNGSIPQFVGNKQPKNEPTSNDSVDNKPFDYKSHEQFLNWDESVKDVLPVHEKPGTAAGQKQFEDFSKSGLRHFSMLRNDPNNDGICSSLSPWFNHGHISFATCIRYFRTQNHSAEGQASFIEEGFVRRELSDNFLWYAPDTYDSLEAGAQWARDSLQLHSSDPREYVYKLNEFESGSTHDDLWNAAQIQMVNTGKMHGFLRMYWAKKILEWTSTPTDALRYAQYLNDKYALDGRDPNGFCGVAWSIFGNHDMGWKEREIFGKIRFMNYNGCKRKFKVNEFVEKYPPAAENAVVAKGNQIVTIRTKKRNDLAAASISSTHSTSSDSDDAEESLSSSPPPQKRQKTNGSIKKKRTSSTVVNKEEENQVEDLSGLSKSALTKKTVKLLKAFIKSKGGSINGADGKPLLKKSLVEVATGLISS